MSNDYPNALGNDDWFYPGDPLTFELENTVVFTDGNQDVFDIVAYHPTCFRFACSWSSPDHITLLDIDNNAILGSNGRFTHTYVGGETDSLYDGRYRLWVAWDDYHENSGPGARILRANSFVDFEIHKYRAQVTFDRSAYIPGETITVFYKVTDVKTGALVSDPDFSGEWAAVDAAGNQLRLGSMPGSEPQGSFAFLVPATAPTGDYDVTLWWNDTLTGGQVRQWVQQESVRVDNLYATVIMLNPDGSSTSNYEAGATALAEVRVTVGGTFLPVAAASVDLTVYDGVGASKTAIPSLGGSFETSEDGYVRYLFAVTTPNFSEDNEYTVEADSSKEQQRMTPVPDDTFTVTKVVESIAANLRFDSTLYASGDTMQINVDAQAPAAASQCPSTCTYTLSITLGSITYLTRTQSNNSAFSWVIPTTVQGTVSISIDVYNSDGDFGTDDDTRRVEFGILLVNADSIEYSAGQAITIRFELQGALMTSPDFFYEVVDPTGTVVQGTPPSVSGLTGSFNFVVPTVPADRYDFWVRASDGGFVVSARDTSYLIPGYSLAISFDEDIYGAGEIMIITYTVEARGADSLPSVFRISYGLWNERTSTIVVARTTAGNSFTGTLTYTVPATTDEGVVLFFVTLNDWDGSYVIGVDEVVEVGAAPVPPPPPPFIEPMEGILLLLVVVLFVLLLFMMRRPKGAAASAGSTPSDGETSPRVGMQETAVASGLGMSVNCRACGKPIEITTSKRPIEVMCPACGNTEIVK